MIQTLNSIAKTVYHWFLWIHDNKKEEYDSPVQSIPKIKNKLLHFIGKVEAKIVSLITKMILRT
jgi:hypothetical protein